MDYGNDHAGFERRSGRANRRNATDMGTTYVRYMQNRRAGRTTRGFEAERPYASYITDILPPVAHKGNAADTIPAKHLHSSLNKVRQPVNVVKWTPDGRRLLTGSTSGEFTLWNGTGFNFETIMQAHDNALRAIRYSHNNEWILSADQSGEVKYWQTNFNNVKYIKAHDQAAVRDVAFSPTDIKFITAGDDNLVSLWDFATGQHEGNFEGHSWDAKCADWHPTKGLIVSGSKDHTMKLWDPRTQRCLSTLRGHKNTLTMTRFEPSQGVLLASCARENIARVFDIRMMRDVFTLKGHEKEISCLTWHPVHSNMLSTGGSDGAMFHYLLDEANTPPGAAATISPYDAQNPADAATQTLLPSHRTAYAHEYAIWSMDWHPLGHILASGSNDRATRFWTRPRPGDESYTNDRWHIGQAAAEAKGTYRKADAQRQEQEDNAYDEQDGLVDQQMPARLPGLPGLPAALPGLPGLTKPAPAFPDGTSIGGAQPMNMGPPPGMDMARFQQLMGTAAAAPYPPPMPPGMPPGMPPPGFQMPAGLPGMVQSTPTPTGGGSIRKRAPLPDQSDALKEEMRQGRYTKAR